MTDSSHRSRPQSSSGQRPRSRSPARSTKLTTSLSYPCIPLLASRAAASSPPAVTSAVAFGSTSATSASPSPIPWINSAETIEDDSPRTPGSILDRQYSGFPWGLHFKEQPQTSPVVLDSGVQASVGELTVTKIRLPVPPHPPLPQTGPDPTYAAVRPKRNPSRASPKSSLRLKLPPPSPMVDVYGLPLPGAPLDKRADNETQGGFVMAQENQRPRHSLLGIAFPTTPDTSVNSMPVICAGVGREGKRIGHVDFRGGMGPNHEVIGAGGATAALLAANPHLASGGLALLTPPDDNGILEWRGEEMSELLVPAIPAAVAKAPCAVVSDSGDTRPVLEGKTSTRSQVDVLKSPEETESTARMISAEAAETTEAGREALDEKEDPSVDKSAENSDSERTGHEDLAEEGWLKGAMASLFDCALSVQMTTEAVRVLAYTLPCPLPTTSSDSGTPTPIPCNLSSNPDRLPASAAAAPAVAAAAGQQFSPAITARCHSRAQAGSGSSTPNGLIGADDGITTALHTLTKNIQRCCSNDGTKRVYIHVSHAISPGVPLNRLPSTPPANGCTSSPGGFFGGGFDSAPGGVVGGGGGYFAPTIFNSIVVAPESAPAASNMSRSPHTIPPPNPILPPFSLHMTLLERYIPPTSITEDVSMFSTQSSVILDRLHELSPQGGSLLFIYPTRTGARHFDKQYLGPVLDPLLRKLMVLYMLREDLLWSIRNMAAVEKMAEFEGLRRKLENFCMRFSYAINDNPHSMWGKGVSGSQMSRPQLDSNCPKTRVRLVYAQKATIQLNDNSWREWWSQQEQLRIREAVKRHFSTLQPSAESQNPVLPSASGPLGPYHAKSASMSSPGLGSFPSMAQAAKPVSASSTPSSPTVSSSQQSHYSGGYSAPGDLAREVLDGIRAPVVRPSSRGMSEAVMASALAGSGTFGVGGVVGDYDLTSMPGDRRVKERGIEVGVFVMRREIVT